MINWPLKKVQPLIEKYQNDPLALEHANEFALIVADQPSGFNFDKDRALALLAKLNSDPADLHRLVTYWFGRMLKQERVKILPDFGWYDGYLYGMCEIDGQQRYFHWMEDGYEEDGFYKPQIFFVYDLTEPPNVKRWEELSQYTKIGQFDEDEIRSDSANLCSGGSCGV